MKNSVFALVMFSLALSVPNIQAQDSTIVHSDDFSDVKGFASTNVNGQYEDDIQERTRSAHVYMSDAVFGGDFKITILEDQKTEGADGKPGVLALSMVSVPNDAEFSGFVYEGRVDDEIKIPTLNTAQSEKEFEQVTIRFRYRAVNKVDEKKAGAIYNCRVEIDVDDSYEYRIDFGSLKSTPEWQTFETKLSSGTNKDVFLARLKNTGNPTFKIVWGQEAEITNYDAGDTLLIDNVSIAVQK